jgi:hypothetical protein
VRQRRSKRIGAVPCAESNLKRQCGGQGASPAQSASEVKAPERERAAIHLFCPHRLSALTKLTALTKLFVSSIRRGQKQIYCCLHSFLLHFGHHAVVCCSFDNPLLPPRPLRSPIRDLALACGVPHRYSLQAACWATSCKAGPGQLMAPQATSQRSSCVSAALHLTAPQLRATSKHQIAHRRASYIAVTANQQWRSGCGWMPIK